MSFSIRKAVAVVAGSVVWSSSSLAQSGQGVFDDEGYTFIAVLWLIAMAFYLIPSWIAFARRHPNRWAIAVINIALGGTGIGWLGSLVWAFSAVHRSPKGSHGGESGLNLFANDPVTLKLEPAPRQPTAAGTLSPAGILDPLARLDQLKRLHTSGTITDEEHAVLRKTVLDQMVR